VRHLPTCSKLALWIVDITDRAAIVAGLDSHANGHGRADIGWKDPTDGGTSAEPIGQLCRELTESVTGHALACLYAADRYHHVEAEIRGHLGAGEVVISDRYILCGLVVQRFDGSGSFRSKVPATMRSPGRIGQHLR
jgi:thymidylate kinase